MVMSLLKFIEKDPRVVLMEEMQERLEGESARQWDHILKNKENCSELHTST